ncbi:MAG: SIR2 family protein, partial [Bacteroidales bacterium]|nr:SIR2 family protein [Bacteroidales bacterium]
MKEYTIEKLAAQLKDKKKAGKKAVLFLGAGASVSAGIPLAGKIIEEIDADENLKEIVQGVERNYGEYFAQLDQSQAKRIFDKHIENSKINLAHLYACHLVKDGYVNCILTTNFDPLVIRTLSIYGIQPTIYDLTISRENVSADLSYPAVVYLHGQNNGFWRLNSVGDFDLAKDAIGKTLGKVIMNRPMIIVGYSGNNDPVFEQLASIDSFADGLYWVTYKDHEPAKNVKKKLLDVHTKGAICIKG